MGADAFSAQEVQALTQFPERSQMIFLCRSKDAGEDLDVKWGHLKLLDND